MVEKVTIWVAYDGSEFNNREECEKYELENCPKRPIGWDAERVAAADAGDTPEGKADARLIEEWAKKLFEDRKARGETRARSKSED